MAAIAKLSHALLVSKYCLNPYQHRKSIDYIAYKQAPLCAKKFYDANTSATYPYRQCHDCRLCDFNSSR